MASSKVKDVQQKRSMAERFPMNVPVELFDSWQVCKRLGDVSDIEKQYGHCRPIIDRALKYGHVKDTKVAEDISKFFKKRLEKETKQGEELMDLYIQSQIQTKA